MYSRSSPPESSKNEICCAAAYFACKKEPLVLARFVCIRHRLGMKNLLAPLAFRMSDFFALSLPRLHALMAVGWACEWARKYCYYSMRINYNAKWGIHYNGTSGNISYAVHGKSHTKHLMIQSHRIMFEPSYMHVTAIPPARPNILTRRQHMKRILRWAYAAMKRCVRVNFGKIPEKLSPKAASNFDNNLHLLRTARAPFFALP